VKLTSNYVIAPTHAFADRPSQWRDDSDRRLKLIIGSRHDARPAGGDITEFEASITNWRRSSPRTFYTFNAHGSLGESMRRILRRAC